MLFIKYILILSYWNIFYFKAKLSQQNRINIITTNINEYQLLQQLSQELLHPSQNNSNHIEDKPKCFFAP